MKAIVYGAIAGLTFLGIQQVQEIHYIGGTILGIGVLLGAFGLFIDRHTRGGK